jgi:electron transfer flavoprotein-quinone oxidoreductase
MTGGRLYSHALKAIIPDFVSTAPIERRVTRERISMITESGITSLDYASTKLAQQGKDSYVVLRGVFDGWLMSQAQAAGAKLLTSTRVDDFVWKDGKVAGVIAAGKELLADVVILADGAGSLLVEKCGLRKEKVSAQHMAVGVKETIRLDEKTIEDRFNLNAGDGMCWLFAGSPTDGKSGGGFIYTNKDSISLGIVVTLAEFERDGRCLNDLLEDFKQHPAIRPLIKDGKVTEYSGHMVPEGGIAMMPELFGDNVLVTGDAAGLVINMGYTVHGMDLAIGSAACAAKAVIHAKKQGNYNKATLAKYKELMDESFVMQEMQQVKNFPSFMINTPRIFSGYPELVENAMANLFLVDDSAPISLFKKIMTNIRYVGLFTILKDAWKGVRSL